jgi:hypothetical protein
MSEINNKNNRKQKEEIFTLFEEEFFPRQLIAGFFIL